MAVFGTNYEMSFDGSKQVPKWSQLVEFFFKISPKQKSFIISQINSSNHFSFNVSYELVRIKIWFAYLKALEMRMRKLVLDLSVAKILSEKINKMFLPKKLGFIDVLSTVHFLSMDHLYPPGLEENRAVVDLYPASWICSKIMLLYWTKKLPCSRLITIFFTLQ